MKRCTYCSNEATTRDHVPGKCLFGTPRPGDLITVDCCAACNGRFGLEDEWFRTVLVAKSGSGDHPAASALLAKVVAHRQHPRAEGFWRSFEDSIQCIRIDGPFGTILTPLPMMNVSRARLNAYAERCIRALVRHETGTIVGDDVDVRAWGLEDGESFEEPIATKINSMLALMGKQSPRVVGDGNFAYWRASVEGLEFCSAWLLIFFEDVAFLGFVIPKDIEAGRELLKARLAARSRATS